MSVNCRRNSIKETSKNKLNKRKFGRMKKTLSEKSWKQKKKSELAKNWSKSIKESSSKFSRIAASSKLTQGSLHQHSSKHYKVPLNYFKVFQ